MSTEPRTPFQVRISRDATARLEALARQGSAAAGGARVTTSNVASALLETAIMQQEASTPRRVSSPADVHRVVAHAGIELKAKREAAGLSQRALAEKLGLARSTIADQEQGRVPVSVVVREWVDS